MINFSFPVSGSIPSSRTILSFRDVGQRWLVFAIDSDFCFYPEEETEELVRHLHATGVDAMHIAIHSEKGHESFLLEPLLYMPHIRWLLGTDETSAGVSS